MELEDGADAMFPKYKIIASLLEKYPNLEVQLQAKTNLLRDLIHQIIHLQKLGQRDIWPQELPSKSKLAGKFKIR